MLRVTFDDGLVGDYDVTQALDDAPRLTNLQDGSRFAAVSISSNGRAVGWNLDQPGHEIDFCADAARVSIEAAMVEKMAERFQDRRSAAE